MTGAGPGIGIDDVRRAAARLRGVAHRTPVLRSRTLDERVGAQVALKAETFQRGGAFKFRGAFNALASLGAEERARGVCTASSGNHAQAVALAAALWRTRAVILMPTDAPALKRAATEARGAEVVEFDRYRDDREALMRSLAAERGLALVHPYDNLSVMAGQGTVGMELVEQAPAGGLDVVVIPVGGGGLLSGCATAVAALAPGVRVVGVEPEASDDVARSLATGQRVQVEVGRTIADGQQTTSPGELTWPVIRALVDSVVTVSDAEIIEAMRFCFERMKLVVEPSGASALAAVLAGRVELGGGLSAGSGGGSRAGSGARGPRVGVVLSGGNVGAEAFADLMRG